VAGGLELQERLFEPILANECLGERPPAGEGGDQAFLDVGVEWRALARAGQRPCAWRPRQ
jgi:hypothetical protein